MPGTLDKFKWVSSSFSNLGISPAESLRIPLHEASHELVHRDLDG
jgi:hypothetical protein